MAGSVLGEKVLRKEDPKFLTTGGVYIDDFTDPRLDGAVHVVFARSPVAHGTINSIDTSDAERHARRDRRPHRCIAGARAAAVGLQPGRGPHVARVRQGALGRRADRGDHRRDVRAGHRRRPGGRRRHRSAAGVDRSRAGAGERHPHLRGSRRQRRVRLGVHGRHAEHRSRVLRGLRGRRQRACHEPARRAVPARATRRRGGVGRRAPARVAVDPARPGRARSDRRNGGSRARRGADPDARRRRRVRRQDRLLQRGAAARRAGAARSAGRCGSRRPAASR